MKNSLRSAARWIKENPDLVVVGTIYTATFGGVIWIVREAVKAANAMIEAYNSEADRKNGLINDIYEKGHLPYQLADGSLLSVPRDADFTVVN